MHVCVFVRACIYFLHIFTGGIYCTDDFLECFFYIPLKNTDNSFAVIYSPFPLAVIYSPFTLAVQPRPTAVGVVRLVTLVRYAAVLSMINICYTFCVV